MTEPYADAAAFRQALEQRLRNAAQVAARGVCDLRVLLPSPAGREKGRG